MLFPVVLYLITKDEKLFICIAQNCTLRDGIKNIYFLFSVGHRNQKQKK